MRVTFVISSLSSGGAERVMSHMANYWSRKGWEVALITLADSNQDFFQLDGRINRRALNITGISGNLVNAMLNNLTRLKNLRRHIVELHPDVVISFIEKTNVLTLLATIFTDIPVIVA